MKRVYSIGIAMAFLLTLAFVGAAPAGATGTVTSTRTSDGGWSAIYQRTATANYCQWPRYATERGRQLSDDDRTGQ